MGSVELQDALSLGRACRVGVGTLADDTLHLEGDGSLGRYRRWSVAESRRDPHTCDLVAETLLQVVKELLVLARGLLGFGLLVIGRKVEVGVCDVRELEVALLCVLVLRVALSAILVPASHDLKHELVHVLSAQEHVKAMVERGAHGRHLL